MLKRHEKSLQGLTPLNYGHGAMLINRVHVVILPTLIYRVIWNVICSTKTPKDELEKRAMMTSKNGNRINPKKLK